jgi:hypothetical protein
MGLWEVPSGKGKMVIGVRNRLFGFLTMHPRTQKDGEKRELFLLFHFLMIYKGESDPYL